MANYHVDIDPEPRPEPGPMVRRWPPIIAAIVGIGCLGAVVVLGLVLPAFQQPLTGSHETFMLRGSVSTEVFGSRPVSITFTSQNEIMQLTAPVKNNHYDIELPAGTNSFEVEVTWNSLPEVFGICYAGTIRYDTSAEAPTVHDFRC